MLAPILAVCMLAEPSGEPAGARASEAGEAESEPESESESEPEVEAKTEAETDTEAEPEAEPEAEAELAPASEAGPGAEPVPAPAVTPARVAAGPRRGPGSRRPGPRWTRWAAPLLSAVIPGAGQAVNRQPGKAVGIFAGSFALTGAAVGVALSRDRSLGATPGEGDGDALEITRLGAISALTSAAGLLYLGQIMDAYAVAVGKWPEPRSEHAVNVEVTRMSTVGMRPGEPRHALYDDFSIAVMGQIVPRVSLGLADLSVKLDPGGPSGGRTTLQAGVRTTWRFFERDRWWLLLGGGFIFQGTGAGDPDPPLDPDAPRDDAERRFGAIPYVQMEARWFMLDRWSLNLAPRVGVPLTDRAYRVGAIPRYATTFELGTGVGVYF